MSDGASGLDELSDLRERVLRLEALFSVIDLLGLPGLLAGGAAKVFDATQTADTLGDQATGFFPKESTTGGLSIRWTRYPELAEFSIPALQGFPFHVELTVLRMPHIQIADDLVFSLSDVGPLPLVASIHHDSGESVFTGEFTPSQSRLLTASLTSRTYLGSSGNEQRRLGVPFVSLRTFPALRGGLGGGS